MSQKFTCARCGGDFDKGWSDEEANAEALSLWGVDNAASSASFAVVCDDCFKKMTGEYSPEQFVADHAANFGGAL